MDAAQLDQFKAQLLQLRSELQAQDAALESSGAPVQLDQTRVGRLSRMDAMQIQQMALESARRRVVVLKRIEGALKRIAAGDFGDCFVCDEPINPKRLSFDPTATRCVDCVET